MDAVIKWVGPRSSVAETFFVVTAVSTALLFLWATRHGTLAELRTRHLRLHIFRGLLYVVEFGCLIYGVRAMKLGNFYALVFTAPLFITALSAVFLREFVGWRSWAATAAGFLGVLVILRPSEALGPTSYCVLLSAVLYAIDVILMRKTQQHDSTAAVMFYAELAALVPAAMLLCFTGLNLTPADLAWMSLAGVLQALALVALVVGFRLAGVAVAAPFNYSQILWGVGIGWAVWREVPDIWTGVGAAIIVVSGLYMLKREVGLHAGEGDHVGPLADG